MYVGGPCIIVPARHQTTRPALAFSSQAEGSFHPKLFTPVRVSVALKDGSMERTFKWRSIPPPADRGGDRVALR